MSTLAERVVDWAWSLEAVALPAGARRAVRRHLLDGWGCALAAARLGAAEPALIVARQMGGAGEARVPGLEDRLSVPAAAFATGALVHALDFDDTHPDALVHPTAAVLPVLSAVSQLVEPDTDTLEAAAAAGYELVLRLGAAIPHGFHARGFHATSVCGVFAATLVAARLLRLSPEQAVNALGIAGSTAAGSMEFLSSGSETKALHPAFTALAAVTSARLAAAGATGPASIFEGRYGLFAAYLQAAAPTDLADDLGARWAVEGIELKPYPCCHLSHATLSAVQTAAPRPVDVVAGRVQLPAASMPIVAEPRQTKLRPRSGYEAKFSLQWTVAALLLDGAISVDTYRDVDRPEVTELAERIDVVPIDYSGPPATAKGHVELVTGTGETLEAVSRPPDSAVTDETAIEKFVANAGGEDAARARAQEVLTSGWGSAGPDL